METLVQVKSVIKFDDKEKLIYDIVFCTKHIFNIDLPKFCTSDDRVKFRDEIRKIIKLSGLKIIDDRIIHTNETTIWKIETKLQNAKKQSR